MNKLQKRQYQEYKINKAIETLFVIDPSIIASKGKKTEGTSKRSIIYQQIAQETQLRVSPFLYGLIRDLLKKAGAKTMISRGYTSYINISTSYIPDASNYDAGETKEL
jgi:hypothetical protein